MPIFDLVANAGCLWAQSRAVAGRDARAVRRERPNLTSVVGDRKPCGRPRPELPDW